MLNVTLKNLLGHKRRMLSTGLAVLLGISFLCGTVVPGDTIKPTFHDLIGNVYSGIDAYVRRSASIGGGEGFTERQRGRVDESLVKQVRGVSGVAAAEGSVNGNAVIEDKNGNALGAGGRGAPSLGGNWQTDPSLSVFKLAEGNPPTKADDVVIDRHSADKAGFHVGDRITIEVQTGPAEFTVSGIARFGSQDSPGGATYALFTLPTAQRDVAQPGKVDAVVVKATPGVSQRELVERLQKVVPTV